MRQIIKRSLWILLLASGLQTSRAFSLEGPLPASANAPDGWQQPIIGYGPPTSVVAPKNIGEEYRRNIPVMYYTCDATFLGFFGSNGVSAVQGSFAILNGLTNVDSYSPDLSEFPLETRHLNYQAQALGLFDLKSWTLGIMMEQLGLANPVEWVWTLHDRFHVGNIACPAGMEYLVVQRNFDPVGSPVPGSQSVLSLYSPYINNVLYSYWIDEFCTGPNPLALTEPFAVDPLADSYSSVATFDSPYGVFFTGLTRDDVAGLRYLLAANNFNWESSPAGSSLLATNLGAPVVITSSNLSTLLTFAQTNAPAAIPGVFPGVVTGNSSNYFAVVCTITTNATIPSQAYGAPYPNNFGALVLQAVTNCAYQQFFVTSFANIITNGNLRNTPNVIVSSPGITLNYSSKTVVTNLTTSLTPAYGQPYPPAPATNTTHTTTTINVPSGEYLVIPAGACGFKILGEITNAPVLTTNLVSTATNANGFVDTLSTVTSFTPHQFLIQPINCTTTTNGPGLREGIEKMRFVYAPFDSLLGQFFQPVTNNFTTVMVSNSQAINQTFQRVVTAPDFLFAAADMVSGPSAAPVIGEFSRTFSFDQTQILPGLAGPGLINSPTTIAFEKAGPVYYNEYDTSLMDGTPYFTETPGIDGNDLYYQGYFVWASFDGTTNDPVVYPDGNSIQNLQNQVLVQIAPTSLPAGTKGAAYPAVTFTATGGAFVYSPAPTWSVTALPSAPSSGLPPGLTLSSGGTLSGTPTQSGAFDFYLVMTDALGRSVQWYYPITIK